MVWPKCLSSNSFKDPISSIVDPAINRERNTAARQLTRNTTQPTYAGLINTTYLLKDNLLYELEKHLNTDEPFHEDGKNLATRFHVKDTHISYATGLLDLLDTVKKLPHDSTSTASRRSYRWIHAKPPTPEPTWCQHYNILKAIVTNWTENQKPTAPKNLSRQTTYLPQQPPGNLGQYTAPSHVLDILLNNQLIQPHSKIESATYYQPTPETITDVTQTINTGILPDRLRIRLLGEFNPLTPPVTQKQFERLLRETEILLRTDETPKITRKELAQGLGISHTHAVLIQDGTHRTTSRYKPKKLRDIATYMKKQIELEKMDTDYQRHAEKLKQIAQEKEEKQK